MIKKTFLLFITALLALASFPGARQAWVEPVMADSVDINPNGSSALSVLMREMQAHAAAARADVMNGVPPQPYPARFDSIYTAQATTEHTRNEYFDRFADLYLMSLRQFSASDKETMVSNYKNLVSSCVVCHTTHCPGPLSAIKKLEIDQDEQPLR